MAEVLRSPSHFPSSPLSCDANDGSHGLLSTSNGDREGREQAERRRKSGGGAVQRKRETRRREVKAEEQLSLLALLLTVFRKSLLGCKTEAPSVEEIRSMEIGWPTDVQHVAHVTFDRFHGFLGLPVEFEPEVHRRAPSASANIFGVSTESMQCSFDSRGNSVPTILLLMQRRLYELGGLGEEGIFRINAENSQEEYVRDQLNNGIVPGSIDVHCLAGLIKAWFRELPTGLLDSLSYKQMMQCETEEDCSRLSRLLPPTEAALLDWAINLMADVAQEEQQNKMNARNVATVFAPNMTQMADPLTALMYAVQVMNFLRMLILKTLKERQESTSAGAYVANAGPSDEDGHWRPQLSLYIHRKEATKPVHAIREPVLDSEKPAKEEEADGLQNSQVTACHSTNAIFSNNSAAGDGSSSGRESAVKSSNALQANSRSKNMMQLNNHNNQKGRKAKGRSIDLASLPAEKSRRGIASLMNSKVELVEAWR